MKLPYTTDIESSPEGTACQVLDTKAVDFSAAKLGRKTAETLIRRAKGGEELITRNKDGQIENTYVAKAGDAIFINLHNADDRYVPADRDGTRWQFSQLAEKGYIVTSGDPATGEVRVKNGQSFRVLSEAVEQPTCIRDAWGPGQHQFLFPGATLKLNDNGSVTGIDKSAFDATWELLPRASTPAKLPKMRI
jgi:hypothetical protein